ncbi:hypothetical protein [Microbispora bryophytorum]
MVCQFDLLRYILTLDADSDGCFWAVFVVAADEVMVAQRRSPDGRYRR